MESQMNSIGPDVEEPGKESLFSLSAVLELISRSHNKTTRSTAIQSPPLTFPDS